MENKLISHCPRCDDKLIATRLSCPKCNLELTGDFWFSKFDYLSSDELIFITNFLKNQGSFKVLQEELGMSYPAAKKKLLNILIKLGISNEKEKKEEIPEISTTAFLPVEPKDSLVIRKIKEKLNSCNGRTTISLFQGDNCEIWYDSNGKGLVSPKIPLANQLTWEAFDAAVEVVIKNGGKAVKGKARSGAKVGSDNLSLDSVEGYIAYKVHGAQEGETAFGPGFVICAVLDWAGVCNNERGYLSVNKEFFEEYENTVSDNYLFSNLNESYDNKELNILENKFNEDMKNIYNVAKKELGYNAVIFKKLVLQKGGVQAAKQLISKEDTYGFEKLRKLKRLDLTVEAHVLKDEYAVLFTNEERELCKKRLEDFGYSID